MRAAPTCSWLPDAVRDLESLAAMPCEPIARRLRPAIGRIAAMNGGAGVRDALTQSGSTPFVRLVDAMAVDVGLAGDPRVALIGRSTVLGYLYVRLQDDLVDEEAWLDRAAVYAMEAVLARHLELLARAGVPASVLCARSRLMTAFAACSAVEYDTRDAADGIAAERSGEKFLGMAVPLVALAALADGESLRGDGEEQLAELVVALGTALQMVNDVLNATDDRAAGRTTPLLRWLGDGEWSRAALIGHPAVTRALELARESVARAVGIAHGLSLPTVASLAGATRFVIDRTEERLLGHAFGIAG